MEMLKTIITTGTITLVVAGVLPGRACAQGLWRVRPNAVASIGDGVGEGQELFSVRDATVAPDGRLLVLDGGSHSIRVYSAKGEFLRQVGRDGDGPGEYRGPRTFRSLPSGELLVHDLVAQRLTRLSADLEVLETQRIEYDVGAAIPVRGQLRPLASGAVLIARGDVPILEAVRRREGLHEDELVVVAHRGGDAGTILRAPLGPTFSVRTGQQSLSPPVPFEEAALFAAGRTGLVVGTTHGTVFRRVAEDGQVSGRFVVEGAPREVTSRDWALFQEVFRRTRSGGLTIRGVRTDPGPNVGKFLESTPRGRRFPRFDALLVDELDRLWVRDYSLEGETVTWQIVDADEGVVGRLVVPRAWTLLEAGSDYILVRERDEFDVEMVRKYVIDR